VDGFRRFISFFAGLFLVLAGILGDCPRFGAIVVGLLLMGMFTVPEALSIAKGRTMNNSISEEDDE